MKKQSNAKRMALHLSYILLAVSLVSLVSCKKPKVEDEDDIERNLTVHDENTDGEIVVSEKYVPIDWDEGGRSVSVADTATGRFVMKIDPKEAKQLKEGSLVTIDVDSMICLRKIKKVTNKNGEVELETEQGDIGELFAGSCFELSFGNCDEESMRREYEEYLNSVEPNYEDDNADTYYAGATRGWGMDYRVRDGIEPSPSSSKKPVKIYPSEYRFYDEETGEWIKVPADATRGDIEKHFTVGSLNLLDLKLMENAYIKGGAKMDLGIGFSLFADIPQDYVEKSEEGKKVTWEDLNDGILKPILYFDPVFDWQLQMRFEGTIKEIKATEAEKVNVLEKMGKKDARLGAIKFMAGPVPVWISNYLGLMMWVEGKIGGGFDMTVGGHGQFKTRKMVGVSIGGRKGLQPIGPEGGGWSYTPSQISTMVNLDADFKLYFGPKFYTKLYDLAGPSFLVAPCVHFNANAGAGFMAGVGGVGFWSMSAMLESASVVVGIKAGLPGVDKDKDSDPIPLATKSLRLMQFPVGIGPAEGESEDIRIEKNNIIKLAVTGKTLAWYPPCFIPTFVVFSTEGTGYGGEGGQKEIFDPKKPNAMFNTMALATEFPTGEVSVGWMPSSKSSSLTAAVYDGHGTILATYEMRPNFAPAGVKAVDLGCSVLWADRNLGADYDLAEGDFYGWGDKTGKHKEQWEKEEYGNYVGDKTKILDYYGGLFLRDDGISHTGKDIVTTQWGGKWRMPTKGHWEELMTKCKWEWDASKNAYKVSGNGNSIYIPDAGWAIGQHGANGDACCYWSSTLDKSGKYTEYLIRDNATYGVYPNAYNFYYNPEKNITEIFSAPRCYQFSVRPVRDK